MEMKSPRDAQTSEGVTQNLIRRFQVLDVIGKRFGRLVVVELSERRSNRGNRYVMCRCDCGVEKEVILYCLRSGHTKSCGCLGLELSAKRATKHGLKGTPIYNAWVGINQRCNNPNTHCFKRYGGRGIKVCERWKDFANFYEDMGERPIGTSIERIDNDGDYEPSNCKWATRKQQNRNQSNNRLVTYNGKTMCLAAWAELMGLSTTTLLYRLNRGWSIKDAIEQPLRNRK